MRDASDATTEIVRAQLSQGTGTVQWHRIDASSAADVVLRSSAELLAGGQAE